MSVAETAPPPTAEDEINFDAAISFIEVARKARAAGDMLKCQAALKLVAVALLLTQEPNVIRLHR